MRGLHILLPELKEMTTVNELFIELRFDLEFSA